MRTVESVRESLSGNASVHGKNARSVNRTNTSRLRKGDDTDCSAPRRRFSFSGIAGTRRRCGGGQPLSPGQQYVTEQLLAEGGENLPRYFERVLRGIAGAVAGIEKSARPELSERLDYYKTAYREVCQMRDTYAKGS